MEIFKLSTYSKWNETHFFWKVLFLTIIGFVLAVGEVSAQTTTWVSMNSDGYDSEDRSDMPSISGDGRYVAFQSHSSLVPEDTTWYTDIYVYDLQAEQLSRVSVTPEGVSANGWNDDPWISANGRHVAFISTATNLIADDTNGYADIYVYDRETGLSHRVSIDSEGNQSNSHSSKPTTSFDGRYVAFTSGADNLVLDDTNGVSDVFVYDHTTGDMTRVSVDSEGNQGNMRSTSPSISADGRFVSFMSEASNLIPDDTNSDYDIFVHDRLTGETTRVSVDSEGNQANYGSSEVSSISANGRYVTFSAFSTNLVTDDSNGVTDVFVHDRETGDTTRVSINTEGIEGNNVSAMPSISADGRYVTFYSYATNLVPDDTNGYKDIFVHDRDTGETLRASLDSEGNEANNSSNRPAISADGSYVTFESLASNLVTEDTYSNYASMEIYAHGPLTAKAQEVSIDIAPRREPNWINPEYGRLIVAILSDESFDATRVDAETVLFGPEEAESIGGRVADIDRDGDVDLILRFATEETGIACGDTEASLTGETVEGLSIFGTDSIITMGCQLSTDD